MAVHISKVRIELRPLTDGRKRVERLERLLTDKQALAVVLTNALQRSVSKAIRRRFLEAQYHMVGMEKEGDTAIQDEKAEQSARIARLQALRDQAFVDDRVDAAKRLNQRIIALSGRKEARLKVEDESSGDLATGKYRPRMKKILQLLVDEPKVLNAAAGLATVGIAPLAQLDAIRTPSYTTEELQKPTNSVYTVMWRQLEFGSGIFATQGTRGPWWFGPYPGSGLHLRGNRPGSFLRSASGVPYDEDAIRFQKEFSQALERALGGE